MILIGRSWQDRVLPSPLSSLACRCLKARPSEASRREALPLGGKRGSLWGRGETLIVALTPIY